VPPGSLELCKMEQPLRAFFLHDALFDLIIKHTLLVFEHVLDDALGSKQV
jgi:hypothetical protein